MNYKIPFFLTLAALIASLYWGYTQSQKVVEVSSQKCEPEMEMVTPDTAAIWLDNYLEYIDSVTIRRKRKNAEEEVVANGRFRMPQNAHIKSFTLPRCELQSMIDILDVNKGIQACLVAKEITYYEGKRQKQEYGIDLMFVGKLQNPDVFPLADDDGNGYFDFTRPCPPVCAN